MAESPWGQLKRALHDAKCTSTIAALEKNYKPGTLATIGALCRTVLPARIVWEKFNSMPQDASGTFKCIYKHDKRVVQWFRDPVDGVGSDAVTEMALISQAVKTYGLATARTMFAIFDDVFLVYGKEGPVTRHDFGAKHETSVCAVFSMPLYTPLPQVLAAPLTLEKRFGLLQSLLKAYIELSNMGWTHRDIKPANILVGDDGLCRLCDFGSCVYRIDQANPDGIGKGLWPHYVQEINYQPTIPDATTGECTMQLGNVRSPWFSLGVTMWEILTGAPPWQYTKTCAVLGHYHAQFYKEQHEDAALRGLGAQALTQALRVHHTSKYVISCMMARDAELRMPPAEGMFLLYSASAAARAALPLPAAGNVCCIVRLESRRNRSKYAQALYDQLRCAFCVEPAKAPSLCHVAADPDGGAMFAWFAVEVFPAARETFAALPVLYVSLDFRTRTYEMQGPDAEMLCRLRKALDMYVSG